jgi:hypothetical protein
MFDIKEFIYFYMIPEYVQKITLYKMQKILSQSRYSVWDKFCT